MYRRRGRIQNRTMGRRQVAGGGRVARGGRRAGAGAGAVSGGALTLRGHRQPAAAAASAGLCTSVTNNLHIKDVYEIY